LDASMPNPKLDLDAIHNTNNIIFHSKNI
jgi:hypothetical protein